jgi:hypothetical protein
LVELAKADVSVFELVDDFTYAFDGPFGLA